MYRFKFYYKNGTTDFIPDFYRIEIINDENNNVIDYIDIKE